ncbi:WbqC family protein [Fodinibius sediminis]|uniref:WbqC-like protein family protein n=1 Tax=Fodinibius sediminis TaxID=1214077 RepID=A0A521C5X8_9BACT|nr:WbqC family protein [Fodinibius sediminis]SMO54856.1 WbqC-like protein family protein [Fodinibius sediminis]
MTLALLSPQLAPNLYDLAIMQQADRIVLQDTEQWSRKSRVHRARIRVPSGTQWINIPVRTEDRKKPIREVRINHSADWISPLLRTLKYNYSNSIYYDFYQPEIKADLESARQYTRLMPFVMHMQRRLLRFMDIRLQYEMASTLPGYTSDPDRFAKRVGADLLYQEYDSRHYLRQAENKAEPTFCHPRYHQHFEQFEPWCSLFDVLFQLGPESFRITDQLTLED